MWRLIKGEQSPESYQYDLADRARPEPSCVTNVLAPAVVEFGKPSAIYTLWRSFRLVVLVHNPDRSYTKDPKDQEKQQFLCVPILRSDEYIVIQ